jgi:hypothetical protein
MDYYSSPFWVKAAVASAAVAASTLLSASMAAAQTAVDLELFLSLDNSGSISSTEYNLQREGYALAFEDAAIQSAIASKPNGVAVALGQWSTTAQPGLAVPWTLLTNAADSNAFAAAIRSITQFQSGSTCVACGINAATTSITTNAFTGPQIIDVSGDGSQNQNDTGGRPATAPLARDAAAALGIKINGLAIEGSEANLLSWYDANVRTSDGFVSAAPNFAAFDAAVKLKIERELNGESVPGPLSILGAGVAFGYTRRLRKRINLATLA